MGKRADPWDPKRHGFSRGGGRNGAQGEGVTPQQQRREAGPPPSNNRTMIPVIEPFQATREIPSEAAHQRGD